MLDQRNAPMADHLESQANPAFKALVAHDRKALAELDISRSSNCLRPPTAA